VIFRSGKISREARSHLLWQLLVAGIGVVVLFALIGRLATAIAPLVVALGLAYLLDPPVSALSRRGFPRSMAIVLLLLASLLVLLGLAFLVVPSVAAQVGRFNQKAPEYAARLQTQILPWIAARLHLSHVPHVDSLVRDLERSLTGLADTDEGSVATFLLGTARGLAGVASKVIAILLVPVFTFYFLRDFPSIERGALALVPPRARGTLREIVYEIDRALHGWIRGELIVMACLAIYYSIGLELAGIDLAVPVGIMTGLLVIIPYLGVSLGLALSLALALLHGGAGPLIGVLVVYGTGQLLEGLVLTPVLVGERVGLGASQVLMAVLVGGSLLGFIGVLLAVPMAAVLRVVLMRTRRAYERSEFYRGVPSDVPPGETAEYIQVGRVAPPNEKSQETTVEHPAQEAAQEAAEPAAREAPREGAG
jgi:predicted PurR-regulated permease PerM